MSGLDPDEKGLTLTPTSSPWVVYDRDNGPFAISVHPNCEDAVRAVARYGYGKVARWPFGMELQEAIETWEAQ